MYKSKEKETLPKKPWEVDVKKRTGQGNWTASANWADSVRRCCILLHVLLVLQNSQEKAPFLLCSEGISNTSRERSNLAVSLLASFRVAQVEHLVNITGNGHDYLGFSFCTFLVSRSCSSIALHWKEKEDWNSSWHSRRRSADTLASSSSTVSPALVPSGPAATDRPAFRERVQTLLHFPLPPTEEAAQHQ